MDSPQIWSLVLETNLRVHVRACMCAYVRATMCVCRCVLVRVYMSYV